ncbi:MAG: ORF6N domain-containing protein [Bacteroidales bacterium]|nr:ORF6N domain-containing protein [Bacteroidales bacterium]
MAKRNTVTNHSNLKSGFAIPSLQIEQREVVANCDDLAQKTVESRIVTIRGQQVILDRDLAAMYQEEVSQFNRQVKRNIKRFPSDFMFQLTKEEYDGLKCQNGISNRRGGDRRALPYAFTEQGVSMLSGLLRGDKAIEVNILIMRAFVAMRRFLVANAQVFQRLDRIEYKQLETDHKFEQVFAKLEEKNLSPNQGIFFDGQIYDAYEFICGLIKSARTRIVLIDNYVDETVLTMLDKREIGVSATIYTQKISKQFQLDITKHNVQYPTIEVKVFQKSHDRFLILDSAVYLVGASLKDLGKKWFAVSLMSETDPELLLSRL